MSRSRKENDPGTPTVPTHIVLLDAPSLKTLQDRSVATGKATQTGLQLRSVLDRLGLRGNESDVVWLTSEQEDGHTMPGYVAIGLGLITEFMQGSLQVHQSSAFDDIAAEGERGMQVLDRVAHALAEWLEYLRPVVSVDEPPQKVLLLFAPPAILTDVIQVTTEGWLLRGEWVIQEDFNRDGVTVLYALT